jgi:hypothetical protein
VPNVHWLHALAAATIIVRSGPSSSSDAKSTAYDIDSVERIGASGRPTFSAEASDEKPRKNANSIGFAIEWGAQAISVPAPAASTAPTKSRAAIGSSLTRLRLGEPNRRNDTAKNVR